MESSPNLPTFRFYKQFFSNDCHELPPPVRIALFDLLRLILNDPDAPSFIKMEQKDGYYASEFAPGYVLYWSLVRGGPKVPGGTKRDAISHEAVRYIEVLKVSRVVDLI